MAMDSAFYLVPKRIFERARVIGSRYKTPNGKYILDQKDLSRIQFTTDEYVNGLDVVKITAEEAKSLIAQGNYQREKVNAAGQSAPIVTNVAEEVVKEATETPAEEVAEAVETPAEETIEETTEESTEETPTEETTEQQESEETEEETNNNENKTEE